MRPGDYTVTLARVSCDCGCHQAAYDKIQTYKIRATNATDAIQKAEKRYAKDKGVDPGAIAVIAVDRDVGSLEWSGEVIEI